MGGKSDFFKQGWQYEEMDEIKTTRNIKFNFSLVLPDTHFSSGKYQTLAKNWKMWINKNQLNKLLNTRCK